MFPYTLQLQKPVGMGMVIIIRKKSDFIFKPALFGLCLTFGMNTVYAENNAKQLDSVVVTATSTETSEKNAPASVSVIDGESVRSRPMKDMSDVLKDLPGVDLQNVGLDRTGVSIRGMDTEHTLYLIDGMRINSSASAIAHSNYELDWIPPEAIERVEVVRGPMSSLYGSEALGGVVNVITRKATDEWHGSVTTYGLWNTKGNGGDQYKTGIYAGGPLVKGLLGVNIWGQNIHQSAYKDQASDAVTVLDKQKSTTGNIAFTLTPDQQQRIDLSLGQGNEDRVGVRSGTGSAVYSSEDNVVRRRYSLTHHGDWDWGSSQVRVYRTTLDRENTRSDGGTSTGPNFFSDSIVDGQFTLTTIDHHKITAGTEIRKEQLNDPTVNKAGKKSLDHYALYLQDEMQVTDKLQLVLGNRFDDHEVYGWSNSPRLYTLYHVNDALTFKAGVGRGFKAPTLKELSPEYISRAAIGGRGIIVGNPDLKPEKNTSFEAGFDYKQDKWSAHAMAFQNNVRNLIDTVRLPTCFENKKICLNYQNIGRVQIRGIELGVKASLTDNTQIEANYTYLDAKNETANTPLANRSKHRANAKLHWFINDDLSTTGQVEFIGSQYVSATQPDYPSYTIYSWYTDYEINKNLTMNAGIENVFNKRIGENDITAFSVVDVGRRVFVSLTAHF